ncbi:Protein RtcB [Chitinispirillum alkaliphilum]|nr:Protein RtcB [Chitinispirillum alkaliphilum]
MARRSTASHYKREGENEETPKFNRQHRFYSIKTAHNTIERTGDSVKKIIGSEKIPIKLWLDDIDEGTLRQAKNLANLPFAFKWIALMPDSHQGYGMPIGGVMAAKNVIVPNAVGVDIGCGMCAVRTSLKTVNCDTLKKIMSRIRETIPLGFKRHKQKQIWKGFDAAPDIQVIQRELKSAHFQLGTLGGGNHFIEIQKGSDGYIWIMIHSGSRNFGLQIAREYGQRAVKACEKLKLPDKDLSFFQMGSKNATEYLCAMNFALDFARENRFRMVEAVKRSFVAQIDKVGFQHTINIHHNYAACETHFGEEVIVHRKGATRAQKGETGLIPGSQGTKSYVVKGKGNPHSFMSCSHGAGRKLGRKQAQRELSLREEKKRLDDLNIIHSIRNVSDLDEAAGAYKNIEQVMINQSDLVQIEVELNPLAVIKG